MMDTESPGSRFAAIIENSPRNRFWWAVGLGISPQALSQIILGKNRPCGATAAKIERMTHGKIRASSWWPEGRP